MQVDLIHNCLKQLCKVSSNLEKKEKRKCFFVVKK